MPLLSIRNKHLLLALAVSLTDGTNGAQTILPFDEPIPRWTFNAAPSEYGNECKIYGADELLICTSSDGTMVAITPQPDADVGGKEVWKHSPSSKTQLNVGSTSGVAFGYNPTIDNFIVHAVTEGYDFVDPSFCVVYAIDPETGEEIWSSQALEGACSGTPVVSGDGEYVFLTHNLLLIGHFTILAASMEGLPFYSQLDPKQTYSPPGIFVNPEEGYFFGGEGNENDVILWSYRPSFNSTTVGPGMTFAFQFPGNFSNDTSELGVNVLDEVTWQSITAPRIFNNGYSMLWAVSRSELRVWNGNSDDEENRFDRGATHTADFPRGDPKSQAAFATPALGNDPFEPMIFGSSASNIFAGFDSKLEKIWEINTTYVTYAEARVSPDDQVIYLVEQDGTAYSVDAKKGIIRWIADLDGGPLTSNFAQSKSGKYLYFHNEAGIVQAWEVADAPSPNPSAQPSSLNSMPSSPPSMQPSSSSFIPTLLPSGSNEISPVTSETSPAAPSTTMNPTAALTDAAPAPSISQINPSQNPAVQAPSSSSSAKSGIRLTLLLIIISKMTF